MSRPLSFFLRPKSDVERAAFEAYQRLSPQRAYAGGGIGPKDVRRKKVMHYRCVVEALTMDLRHARQCSCDKGRTAEPGVMAMRN